jgi:hypothetical protein
MWLVHLFTEHLVFWSGVFAGGAGGYLSGAVVKASLLRELNELRAEIAKVRKIV